MAAFVLVHGGALGGWSWRAVAGFLRAAGHEVHAPTLTGLGERAHLASPAVGLETHVQDVVNLLYYEDLSGVVLVGFSYGGMVVTGAADRVPERIARLVYVDGLVPRDGECAYDHFPPEQRAAAAEHRRSHPGEWLVPLEPGSEPRATPQPRRTLHDPIRLVGHAAHLPVTFIRCTQPPHPAIELSAERARREASWRYRELPCGHGAPKRMPGELAGLLLATF